VQLLRPYIDDCRRIIVCLRDLHERAYALRQAELRGGTFTISNLGMYGVDSFTPIINAEYSTNNHRPRIVMLNEVKHLL
jgi:pyruvate/2-oxoglutarate dehydrogenase complex dihydrolipoamide acyltransferase (E2) component